MTTPSTYQQAHQILQSILQDKLFHTPVQPLPWWMRVIRWIANHLHIDLGAHTLRYVGLALVGVCIVFVITAGFVLWRVLQQRAQGRAVRISTVDISHSTSLKDAKTAFSAGEYEQMLHFLVEGLLRHAALEGWVRLRPSKTLRTYGRELLRRQASMHATPETSSANPVASLANVTSVFQMAAELAEAAWFGQQPIDRVDAQRVLDAAAEVLEEKGMEAS